MRTISTRVGLALFIVGCGGETAEMKPLQPPPPPTVESATPPLVETAAKPETPPPAKPALLDLQKQSLKSYADAVSARDAKAVAALYAEDATLAVAGAPEVKGREAITKFTQEWFDGMSSTKLAYSKVWTKGDVMVVEWTTTAKHTGEFMGVKASNKDTSTQGISVVWSNADGTIKGDHRYFDMATGMTHIGASKEKARPVATLPANTEWIGSTGKPDEDKNVDLVKQFYGFLDKGDDKGAFGLLTDDGFMDDYSTPALMKKPEAHKYYQGLIKGFPEFKQTWSNAWAAGEYVVVEGVFNGTHKAAFQGIPATKKPVSLHFVDVSHVKDGKIKSVTTYLNNFEFMTQLGLMKPPPAKKDAAPAAPKKDEKPAAPAPKKDEKPAAPAPKK